MEQKKIFQVRTKSLEPSWNLLTFLNLYKISFYFSQIKGILPNSNHPSLKLPSITVDNMARLQLFNLINLNEMNLSVYVDRVTIITVFEKFSELKNIF